MYHAREIQVSLPQKKILYFIYFTNSFWDRDADNHGSNNHNNEKELSQSEHSFVLFVLCTTVCPSVPICCERDIWRPLWGNFFQFGATGHLDSKMNWLDSD